MDLIDTKGNKTTINIKIVSFIGFGHLKREAGTAEDSVRRQILVPKENSQWSESDMVECEISDTSSEEIAERQKEFILTELGALNTSIESLPEYLTYLSPKSQQLKFNSEVIEQN